MWNPQIGRSRSLHISPMHFTEPPCTWWTRWLKNDVTVVALYASTSRWGASRSCVILEFCLISDVVPSPPPLPPPPLPSPPPPDTESNSPQSRDRDSARQKCLPARPEPGSSKPHGSAGSSGSVGDSARSKDGLLGPRLLSYCRIFHTNILHARIC